MKQIKKIFQIIIVLFTVAFLFGCSSKTYEVTFDLGYDDKTEIVEVNKGEKVNRPTLDPTRDGYTFIEWYLNDLEYDFNLEVTKDITIKAFWKEIIVEEKVTITFDLDYEDKTQIIGIDKGEKVNRPTNPTREGFEFLGWFINDIEYDFNLEISEDITIKAFWKEIIVEEKVTITFDLDHDDKTQVIEINKGEKVNRPTNPTRENYEFLGWFINDIEYDFNLEVTKDITIKALWKEIIVEEKVTITFDLDYDDKTEVIEINKGEKVNRPTNPTRENYEFIGWFINDIEYDFNLEATKDITIKALWKEIIVEEKVTITYDLDYEDKTEVIEINKGEKVNRPTNPRREGFEFIGWFINDIEYDFNVEATKDITIKALWKEIIVEEKVTITFDLDYDDKTEVIEINKGEKVNKPTNPTREGFEFLGWFINDIEYDFNLEVSKDITIKALWEEIEVIITHFIVFNSNGGDYNPEKQNIFAGEYGYKPENPTKEGYVFHGWFYADVLFDFSQPIEKDYLLVAKWILPIDDETLFKIFYLNDTHGAVLNNGSEIGLAKLGNYIRLESDENSIFITGGDMLQGQLISNASDGAIIIEIFNNLNLDAFVLGNHEFDWGLDVVLQYFDPNTSGVKANFPVLGANVKQKSNDQRPDFVDSYVIIERGSYKIGIIGVMGDGLESSIATLRVKDYYFSDAYTAVKETVDQIKSEVDFILVVNHHSDSNFNNKVAKLDKVQAVFNGHTHRRESGYTNGIPYLQSGANGESLGQIDLKFNRVNGITLLENDVKIIRTHEHFNQSDEYVEFIIDAYYEEIKHLYEEDIINASKYLSDKDLSYFIAKLMAKSTNAVFAFQNYGGTRAAIEKGPVKASDIFKVFPFDNKIITVEILGRDLKTLYNRETYAYLDISYNDILNNVYYVIATNDYLFYSDYNSSIFRPVYDEAVVHGDLYETFYSYLVKLSELGYSTFDNNSPFDFEFGYLNTSLYYFDERKYLYNYL